MPTVGSHYLRHLINEASAGRRDGLRRWLAEINESRAKAVWLGVGDSNEWSELCRVFSAAVEAGRVEEILLLLTLGAPGTWTCRGGQPGLAAVIETKKLSDLDKALICHRMLRAGASPVITLRSGKRIDEDGVSESVREVFTHYGLPAGDIDRSSGILNNLQSAA